jgi:hypothetical protein
MPIRSFSINGVAVDFNTSEKLAKARDIYLELMDIAAAELFDENIKTLEGVEDFITCPPHEGKTLCLNADMLELSQFQGWLNGVDRTSWAFCLQAGERQTEGGTFYWDIDHYGKKSPVFHYINAQMKIARELVQGAHDVNYKTGLRIVSDIGSVSSHNRLRMMDSREKAVGAN